MRRAEEVKKVDDKNKNYDPLYKKKAVNYLKFAFLFFLSMEFFFSQFLVKERFCFIIYI